MEPKITTHITKGILIALVLIVLSLVGHVTNIILETWFSWTSTGVFCAGVIWATIYYANQMNNNVTFGNLFAHGFKVSAVVTCIVFVFTVLSMYVIFPGFIDQVVQKGLDEARKKGNVSEDQLEQGMGMIRKIVTITMLAGTVVGSLVVGAIAAVIGAAVAKKNPQDPFTQQPM